MVMSEREGGIEVVSFSVDRINALNVDEIRPAVQKMFDIPYTRVVIDMNGVQYLDSTGFAMLLHLHRSARSNYCSFKLCNMSAQTLKMFQLLQLDQALEVYPDRRSCIESFLRPGSAPGSDIGHNKPS